jgi:hypothetical protein
MKPANWFAAGGATSALIALPAPDKSGGFMS